jgi:hypothetical protein
MVRVCEAADALGVNVVVGITVTVGTAVDVRVGTALTGAATGLTNFFGGGFDGGVASAFIFARAFCATG